MKQRAPRNRTITLSDEDRVRFAKKVINGADIGKIGKQWNRTYCGECFDIIQKLEHGTVNLLILDPPYNMSKSFNGNKFTRVSVEEYTEYLDRLFRIVKPILAESATIYICGDWYSSTSIFNAATKHFYAHNRITWEREKGRGAKTNWKNSSEDIWFCTISKNYTFNVDAVKMRRKVIAPYRNKDGSPKDWNESSVGNYRDTSPSNIWFDISVPFWSMPENTDHPTQKSEKLIAKLILASSNKGDLVLDPFVGSGTTSVVASKLGRRFIGIDNQMEYCLLTEKRLEIAEVSQRIQGHEYGVFWERNSLGDRSNSTKSDSSVLTDNEATCKTKENAEQSKLKL